MREYKNTTYFRKWATNVLKDYLLRGYSVNPRLEQLERRVAKTEEKIDFFVKTALPPVAGIFYDGQIFQAYEFVSKLIKRAKPDQMISVLLFERISANVGGQRPTRGSSRGSPLVK